MKELHKKESDKIVNVKQVGIEKKQVLIGRNIPHNGHKVWEYNKDTREIILDKVGDVPKKYPTKTATNNIAYFAKHNIETKGKVETNPNCIYITALNKKNVIKILKRNYGIDVYARIPHGFCETPEEKCTMNYCDENGCQNRKRHNTEENQQPIKN